MKCVAIYLRVSTGDQTVENQRRELKAVAKRHGWAVVKEFRDEGISGTKGREKRPGFDALLQGIAKREFDQVMAWSLDRLSRRGKQLLDLSEELKAKHIDLYIHSFRGGAMDTSTPNGQLMFTVIAGIAEWERSMIVERVRAGLARAKAEGRKGGRPVAGKEKDAKKLGERKERDASIRNALASGMGIVKVAKNTGCRA